MSQRFAGSLATPALPSDPDPDVKTLVYRAAQEALSNIARHAQPNTQQSQTVDFPANVPATLSLAYPEGRVVAAREVLDRELPSRKPPVRERRGPTRDAAYRAWIRTLPCAACGSTWNVEAAHTGRDGGMSMKSSDYSCVALCSDCHRQAPHAYHVIGRDAFERRHSLSFPKVVACLSGIWEA